MSTRDDLVDLIELGAVTRHSFGQIADAILKAGWRPPAREITTVEELEALPNNEERAIPQEAVEAACNAFQRPNRMLINTSDGNLKGRLEAAFEAAEPHLRKKWAEGVVCLCGSTRFRAEIVEANRLLTLEGHIVLAPGVFGHDGDPITDDEKAKLDALHLRKIDMAEQVIVIAPGGYIGESTRREIAYAESTGKPVIIWNQITLEGAGE